MGFSHFSGFCFPPPSIGHSRHICVINRIFSHLFQILVTLSSHFSCILLAIEGDELSIIFFFFIRAGTKVPASFHLWSIFFHSLIIEIRNKAF